MKKTLLLMLGLTASACFNSTYAKSSFENSQKKEATLKGPEVLEVLTNYNTISEALIATKMALMKEKFIATNGIQETSFTAKRTTGSDADYYIADVMATTEQNGTVKLTITFMKIGSGMLKLSKVSKKVEESLNLKESSSNTNETETNDSSNESNPSQTKKLSFGLVFGGNLSSAKGDDIIEEQDFIEEWGTDGGVTSRIGLRFGCMFDYSFHERVSLTTGLIYSQKGWNTMIEREQEGIYNKNYELAYIDVPLLLTVYLNKTIYLQGGAMVAFKFKDNVHATFDVADDAPAIYESHDRNKPFKESLGRNLKKRVFGYQIALGLDLKKGWQINLAYQKTGEMFVSGYDYANATTMLSLIKYFGQ